MQGIATPIDYLCTMNHNNPYTMYKKFPLLLCAMFLGLALASCEKEQAISVAPKYYANLFFTTDAPKTITLENQDDITRIDECNVGDSITVFIPVIEPGDNITYANYYWQLCSGNTIIQGTKQHVVAPHRQTVPPMWTFKAPDASGSYRVKFRAEYNYSSQTIYGEILGQYPAGQSYEGANTLDSKLTVN